MHDNVDIVVADGLLENPTEKVKREKPNVVGISSTTLEFSNAIKIAQEVKKEFSIPIIIGGVHISALPWMLPQCFDIGVVGEGEQTMLELMQLFLQHWAFPTKELKEIKGIVFHNEDKVVITEQQPFIDPK
ncbi:cobalamin-dependent protein [Dehalococcoidia bacterium]|nr:cobalamin-dependent protein [Dehalococcoidia bacterium]